MDGNIDKRLISKRVESSGFLSWLIGARLARRFPFQIPTWKSEGKQLTNYIQNQNRFDSTHIPSNVSSQKISLVHSPLLTIDIFHNKDNFSVILVSWHHCVMDAHGAEMMIELLGGSNREVRSSSFFPKKNCCEHTFLDKLNQARPIKQFLAKTSYTPFLSLTNNIVSFTREPCYRLVKFSPSETVIIDRTANRVGANFRKSALYLGATARALFQVLKKRGPAHGDFVVPVPQDQRKRGTFGPVLSNHVTFLFYRINEESLADLTTTVSGIVTQMKEIVRTEIQKCYSTFMDLCRRLPLGLYVRLLKSPTKGNIASFFFSDTGELLDGFNEFLALPVLDAVHYPPNLCPPGFTIIFSRFRGALQATVAYTKECISEEELDLFEHFLRIDLHSENRQ